MGQPGDTGAANMGDNPRAVIFGCSGVAVTAEEKSFFAEADPAGFILFERNCLNPDQVLRLVTELKEITGRADRRALSRDLPSTVWRNSRRGSQTCSTLMRS